MQRKSEEDHLKTYQNILYSDEGSRRQQTTLIVHLTFATTHYHFSVISYYSLIVSFSLFWHTVNSVLVLPSIGLLLPAHTLSKACF